jgi:hypothetical protein
MDADADANDADDADDADDDEESGTMADSDGMDDEDCCVMALKFCTRVWTSAGADSSEGKR